MKRIEYLKNINVKNLRLAHLSKNCYLLTYDKNFILKASTFENWKKYIFNFKEVKFLLNIIKEVQNINDNFIINFYKINDIISISLINNKIVYEVVKIDIKQGTYENTLIFYGRLKELCEKNNLIEKRFV